MGGTLPAAARAVTPARDRHRRSLGLLYGMNELGAVLGAAASTFYLLEHFGTRRTLWLACLVFLVGAEINEIIADRADAIAAPRNYDHLVSWQAIKHRVSGLGDDDDQ